MQYDFEVPEFDEISSNAKVCDNTVRPHNSTLFDLKKLQKNQCVGYQKTQNFLMITNSLIGFKKMFQKKVLGVRH